MHEQTSLPPFFLKSPGPLVSILLPSRGDPKGLVASIESLVDTAYDKASCEFVLRLDEDDVETLETISGFEQANPCLLMKKLVGPRKDGYGSLDVFTNDMARVSTGDWLVLWDDDFRMMTSNWDVAVYSAHPCPVFPWTHDIHVISANIGNTFTCLRRETYNLLGHISLSFLVDSWVHSIMTVIESITRLPIVIDHSSARHPMTDNKHKAYWKAARRKVNEFQLKIDDLTILVNKMREYDKKAIWTKKPYVSGWYIWKDPLMFSRCVYIDGKIESKWIVKYAEPYYDKSFAITGKGIVLDLQGKIVEDDAPRWHFLHN